MGLLDLASEEGGTWVRVRDRYEVTKKPRSLDVKALDSVPFIPMEAVPKGGRYEPDAYVSRQTSDLTGGTYFERGNVLVAKITPSFENGKQALTRGIGAPFGYATTEVIPLRAATAEWDERFLFFYLLHPDVRHYVAERMEGSTGRQRVSEDLLLDLPIPDFTPEDQAKAADAFEAIHRAIQLEVRADATSSRTKVAAMRELFSRGLRGEAQKNSEIGPVPESWDVVPLGSLGRIGNGSTPKRSVPEYWTGGSFPWLNSAKVYERDIEASDQFVTDVALAECHLPRLEPGAVLVAITGQGKTLGHVAVLRTEATINQHLAYLQTELNRADPGYIRGYLETQYNEMRQVASGGGSTKGALTCAYLRGVAIPLPPTVEGQREIVEVLDAIERKIELHRRKRHVLEQLFTSLLHKLMIGEIAVDELDLSLLQAAGSAA